MDDISAKFLSLRQGELVEDELNYSNIEITPNCCSLTMNQLDIMFQFRSLVSNT